MKTNKSIRIGAGAGYSGDRLEPAVELAEKGRIDYLVFECLAERTIALAQQQRRRDPQTGFDPLLEARWRVCLPVCRKHGVRIITNMGAANPVAAMHKTAEVARGLGLPGLKIAAVTGDDVLDAVRDGRYELLETGNPLSSIRGQLISANAYLGAAPVVEALQAGADIVITGRVADPALFLAPLIFTFGWPLDDWDLLGQGTVLGHLLECAGQVTGGYFAEPGLKDVPGLARLGFPIADVQSDGTFFITKVAGTGGLVTEATCKEQLLYEIHDPAYYLTPDVIADFTGVRLQQPAPDQVLVIGGKGKKKTGKLKVSLGYRDGYLGEGQISYGGPGALERGQLALEIVRERLRLVRCRPIDVRFDLIGVNALYGSTLAPGAPAEVRARVAARTATLTEAVQVGNEVEALYTNGPAGGGGAFRTAQEVIAVQSILIDEALAQPALHFLVT